MTESAWQADQDEKRRWARRHGDIHVTEQKKSPVEDGGFEWCEELVFHQPPSV